MMHHQSTSGSEAGAVVGACFTTNYYYYYHHFPYIGSSRWLAPRNPGLGINAHHEQFIIRGAWFWRSGVLVHAEGPNTYSVREQAKPRGGWAIRL